MKKVLKTLSLGLILSMAFVINVDAATITEEVKQYEKPVFIMGSTRFDSSEVISADAVLAAGFNHAIVQAMLGVDISNINYKPEVYYYDPDFKEWHQIKGADIIPLEEDKVEEIEENLDIYYVNNEVKKLEIEYSGSVDEVLTTGVTYDGTKFVVPAIVPSIKFTSNGEEVTASLNTANKETIDEKAVITVNGMYFTEDDINAAILASTKENPAVLLKDLELKNAIVLDEANLEMALDLGGHTLTADKEKNPTRVLTTSGANSTLTIKNGTITAEGAQLIAVGKKELESERATLNIEKDVIINGYWYGIFTIGDTAVANLKGTINILEDGYAIAGNGTKNVGYDGTEINILEGAVINAQKGHALYLAQAGTANISGGTLTANTVIGIKSGKLNITGGTLTATGEKATELKMNNNGINITGDVIYAEVNDSYAKNIEINVTGGTLTSEKANIIREFKSASADDIKVTGLYTTRNVDSNNSNITVYTTKDDENAVITVNGMNYREEEINAAILVSTKENPAVLLKDLELKNAIVLDVENLEMALDLGGHTLTSDKEKNPTRVLTTSGANSTLTIKNGTITAEGAQLIAVGKKELESERATLNIEKDVIINGYWYGIFTIGDTAVANLKGTINILEDGYAIAGNGTKNVGYDGTEINILEGAVINAPKGHALYLAQAGTANISGGTLTANTVIGIKSGKLNITGGTLTATGEKATELKMNNNGINITGDVIYAEVNDSYAKNIEINVTGGTLTSEKANIIREFKSASADDIKVTGLYTTRNVDSNNSNITVYTSEADAVVSVDGNYYSSIQDAIDAAKSGSTVKVLKDVELANELSVHKELVLDLNGKTLKPNSTMTDEELITVYSDGKLTVEGNGKFLATSQNNDYSTAIWAYGGEIIINNGYFTNLGGKDAEDNGTPNNNELIYVSAGGKGTINGGTFIGNSENRTHGAKFTLNLKDKSGSTMIVTGGTYTNFDPSTSRTEPSVVNFVAEGYKVVKEVKSETETLYTVVKLEETDIALVDGNYYSSIQDAIDAAKSGSTVKVLKDVELANELSVHKELVLDLNGKTLKPNSTMTDDELITVYSDGKLTVEGNGKFLATSQNNDYSTAIWANGGEIIINSGYFTNLGGKDAEDNGTPNNNELIYVSAGGKGTINGGTFIGNSENRTHGAKFTLNLKDKSGSTMIVTGGTYTNFNPSTSRTEPSVVNFVAEGYKVVKEVKSETETLYTVVKEA